MSATFKPIVRIKINATTEKVISQVIENGEVKGLNINDFIMTEKYTGPTKGTFIPASIMEEFGDAYRLALSN